jgi:hypothetical protein
MAVHLSTEADGEEIEVPSAPTMARLSLAMTMPPFNTATAINSHSAYHLRLRHQVSFRPHQLLRMGAGAVGEVQPLCHLGVITNPLHLGKVDMGEVICSPHQASGMLEVMLDHLGRAMTEEAVVDTVIEVVAEGEIMEGTTETTIEVLVDMTAMGGRGEVTNLKATCLRGPLGVLNVEFLPSNLLSALICSFFRICRPWSVMLRCLPSGSFCKCLLSSVGPNICSMFGLGKCTRVQGYVGQGKRAPDFFSHTTRNAKILMICYTNIFLRKLHRSISGSLLSLISLSESLNCYGGGVEFPHFMGRARLLVSS